MIDRSTARDASPIGRGDELEAVLAALDQAVTEPGHAVWIMGEAGLGKTTLLDAALARLDRDGVAVAGGRALADEAAYPYAALQDVVASLTAHRHTDVARAASELETALAHGMGAVDEEAELHRRVYWSAAQVLTLASEHGPLVVAIDDLHVADADSLALLGLLVRRLTRLPIAWLATVRTDLPERRVALDGLLHALAVGERFVTVELGPLSDDHIRAVIEGALDGPVLAPGALSSAVELGRGNPFYAIHTALALAGEAGGGQSLSRRVALLQRVLPLGAEVRSLARLLAVAGSCSVGRLRQCGSIVGLDEHQVELACDRMVRARILVGSERLAFTHGILRDALYADLGPAERRRIHSELADRLTSFRRRGDVVDVLEIARHIMAVAPEPDAERATLLGEAGDSVGWTAPRSAIDYYRAALDRLPAEGRAAGSVGVRLAAAAWRAGEVNVTIDAARAALALAPTGRMEHVVLLLGAALGAVGRPREGLEVLDEHLGANDDSARQRALRAGLEALLDRDELAQRDAQIAIELAGDVPIDLVTALDAATQIATISVRDGLALGLLERELAAADRVSAPWQLRARRSAAYTYACVGEITAAREALADVQRLEADVVDHGNWDLEIVARVLVAFQQGEWNEARTLCLGARSELDDHQHALCATVTAFAEGNMALAAGDPAAARAAVEREWPTFGHVDRIVAVVLAGADAYEGRLDDAQRRLEIAVQAASAPFRMTASMLHRLVEFRVEAGDHAGATAAVRQLDDLVGDSEGPAFGVIAAHARAMADADPDAALGGAELASAHGLLFLEATLRYEAGRLGAEPEENLLAALALFNRAGATVSRRKAVAELRRFGIPVPRQRRVFGLTDVELDISRLVQEGRRNREIAEQLHYSEKTVEAYLSRIYAKTGCANRLALARHFDALEASGTAPGQ